MNKIRCDGVDSSGSEKKLVTGVCERASKPSGYTKGGKYAAQPQQIFVQALYSSSFTFQIGIQKIYDVIGNNNPRNVTCY
jgi:hypothetical protein